PQRQDAVLPDPGAARCPEGEGDGGAAVESRDHRLGGRLLRQSAGDLLVSRQQGRRAASRQEDGEDPDPGSQRVLAARTGPVPTDMNKIARDTPEFYNGHIPANRVGKPEDIAGAAVFLVSRAGDYVVGTTVTVDGGVSWGY